MHAVTEALRCRDEVRRLQEEIAALESQRLPIVHDIESATARQHQSARAAACGEAARLAVKVEALVEAFEPLPYELRSEHSKAQRAKWGGCFTKFWSSQTKHHS